MKKVRSVDGTAIAYDQVGNGPAVILVNGALGYRAMGFLTPLANLLAQHFTVIDYDRRGRGESTDTQPFAVEREIEDIEALINEVGGEAYLYGISSGACLALEAAIKLGGNLGLILVNKTLRKRTIHEFSYAAVLSIKNIFDFIPRR